MTSHRTTGVDPARAAARPHGARRGARRHAELLQGADRARHRGPAAGPGGRRPRTRRRVLRPAHRDRAGRHATLAADCELAVVVGGDGSILRARRGDLGERDPGARGQPGPRRLPRRGRGRRRRGRHRRDRRAHAGRRRTGWRSTSGPSATASWSPSTFALNEASVEKAARERMIEVVVEIDGRPLSRWGCDGVVLATPTGSTAYNFSAGGPIVWPGVEALLIVPISAHALFARPLVVAPDSLAGGRGDRPHRRGRRALVRRPQRRSTCRRAPASRYAARTGRSGWPACTRRRSPTGWWPSSTCRSRAGAARPSAAAAPRTDSLMLEEIRIGQLGVIESSRLELGPGLTVITGETGAGKTMVVTALGLLLGGRADSGRRAHRRRHGPGRGRGRRRRASSGFAAAVDEAGGEVEDGRVVLARNVSARAGRAPGSAGASVPVSRLAEVTSHSSRCTASPTSTGCSGSARSARPWTGSAATPCRAAGVVHGLLQRARGDRAGARGGRRDRPGARPRGRPAPVRARGDRGGRPHVGRGPRARGRGVPPRLRRHPAHRRRAGPGGAVQRRRRPPTRWRPPRRPGRCSTASATTTPRPGELADRLAEITYLLSDVAADVASYASRLEPTRPGSRRSPSGGRR